jgi:tRNA modification GTPase
MSLATSNPNTETIVAIATPPGMGGIGVVRLSGPACHAIGQAVLREVPPPRYAGRRDFIDAQGQAIDSGLALYFPQPHSYTGEDVLELHGHGSPVALAMLVDTAVALGARRAEPGEFTQRAFLNGKLDLAQAEAVADLIASASAQAARSALNSLQGAFSEKVQTLIDELLGLRVQVEGDLDFPEDEDAASVDQAGAETALAALNDALAGLLQEAQRGLVLNDGLNIALVGAPNVGKSSLFNALAREQRVIVNTAPGTTRDVIRQSVLIEGVPVQLIDTAGLRESEDPVEREGIKRAQDARGSADLVIEVREFLPAVTGETGAAKTDPPGLRDIVVYNKIDIFGQPAFVDSSGACPIVYLSALSGEGVDGLEKAISNAATPSEGAGGDFSARARHMEALLAAQRLLVDAAAPARAGSPELLAEHLRLAQQSLAEISGGFTTEQLLGEIFARFCIGK